MKSVEMSLNPRLSAVYFLLAGTTVVYIGQTKDLRNSFHAPRHMEKLFQRARYVEVAPEELNDFEMACIVYFQPKYNRKRHTNKVPFEAAEARVRAKLTEEDLEQFGVARRDPCRYEYKYPRPSVTVDCVVFGFDLTDKQDPLKVLLIQRNSDPYAKYWAIPGGFVDVNDGTGGESLERAAQRELEEETGLRLSIQGPYRYDPTPDPFGVWTKKEPETPAYLEQLYTFGAPGRDPRGRVISVAYFVLVRASDYNPQSGSDADQAKWVGIQDAMARNLAFDHADILSKAMSRLQGKIRYEPIGFNLLPLKFTLSDLRELYEAILQRQLDFSNFRKRMLATGVLTDTGETSEGAGRPARFYQFDKRAYDKAVKNGFNFEI